MIKLFTSPEETNDVDSDNFHSLLFGLVYLEVLTRSHCKEDGKGNKWAVACLRSELFCLLISVMMERGMAAWCLLDGSRFLND